MGAHAVRKQKYGYFQARDRRTDGPHEWHDDVLLWSFSGISEVGWEAALECTALADDSSFNDRNRYHIQLDWLTSVDKWYSANRGHAYCIENGVG